MAAQKTVEIWRTVDLISYVLNDLEKRVKKDKATKLSVFFTGLSAYLPQPINLFLKGESGVGKTYNVVETLKYFPQEDIWFLGGLSPKALIHDYGTLLNKHGEPLDLTEKPVKPKKNHYKDDMGEFKEAEYREALERYKEQLKAWRKSAVVTRLLIYHIRFWCSWNLQNTTLSECFFQYYLMTLRE